MSFVAVLHKVTELSPASRYPVFSFLASSVGWLVKGEKKKIGFNCENL